jgi:tetratricopeptide (TPR) repeat protein
MAKRTRKRSRVVRSGALILAALSGVAVTGGCGSNTSAPVEQTRKALSLTPAPPELAKAATLHRDGKLKEALELYTKSIKLSPRCPEALNWRGMLYDDLGKPDNALADLNQAVALKRDYADAYNNRGEVYRKKGMLVRARADYEKALALDGGFQEVEHNLTLLADQERLAPDGGKEDQRSSSRSVAVIPLGVGGASPAPTAAAVAPKSSVTRGGMGSTASGISSSGS